MIIVILILMVAVPFMVAAFIKDELDRKKLPSPQTPAEAEARRVQANKERRMVLGAYTGVIVGGLALGAREDRLAARRPSIPARQSGYLPLQSQYRPVYQQPVQQLGHNGPNPADYGFVPGGGGYPALPHHRHHHHGRI